VETELGPVKRVEARPQPPRAADPHAAIRCGAVTSTLDGATSGSLVSFDALIERFRDNHDGVP
jgi:hypothetical protein